MTVKDFFRFLIKLFALYAIITSLFYSVPTLYMEVIPLLSIEDNPEILYYALTGTLSSIVVILLYIYFLLVKTDKIISILKLERGFDSEIFNFGTFDSSKIVELSCLLIGGFFIVSNLSEFIVNLYDVFVYQVHFDRYNISKPNYSAWSVGGIKIMIGYLLIQNREFLSKKIK